MMYLPFPVWRVAHNKFWERVADVHIFAIVLRVFQCLES